MKTDAQTSRERLKWKRNRDKEEGKWWQEGLTFIDIEMLKYEDNNRLKFEAVISYCGGWAWDLNTVLIPRHGQENGREKGGKPCV